MYIYIYTYRERDIYVYTYTHIHTYVANEDGNWTGTLLWDVCSIRSYSVIYIYIYIYISHSIILYCIAL